ncbi:adenylate/guanylate cyclase domain-containing protein [Bacteroidota bacterium]
MRYIFLLLIILFLGFDFFTQDKSNGKNSPQSANPKIDSLSSVLEQSRDTTRINLLLELANEYKDQNIERSLELAEEALSRSQKLGFIKGNARAHERIGAQYQRQGKWDDAIYNYSRAYEIYEELDYKLLAANQLFYMGLVHDMQGNYEKALEHYNLSLNSKKELNDIPGQINVLSRMGWVYTNIADYPAAMVKLLDALKLAEEINSIEGIIDCKTYMALLKEKQKKHDEALKLFKEVLMGQSILNDEHSMARTMHNIALIYYDKFEIDSALVYCSQAFNHFKKINISSVLPTSSQLMGSIYLLKENYKEAKKYYLQSLRFAENIEVTIEKINTYIGLSNCYSIENNFQEALKYSNKALDLAKENDSKEHINLSHYNLSTLYEKMKNYKSAFEHYQLYSTMKDSIFTEKNEEKMMNLQVQYETEKKEREIELLKKDNLIQQQIQYSLVVGIILILLIAALMANRYRLKKKTEIILISKNKELEEKSVELRNEKETVDNLLYNILPVEIADELKEKGTTTPFRHEEVTILFTDFKGFTNIVATMPPEKLVSELNDMFQNIDDIIVKYHMEKIKTIGDSYLIASGLPKESKNHAVQCISAALEIAEYINQRNIKSSVKWQIRLGVHSGPVVAGVVGKRKFAFDVWGDTVNIASRMEASSEPGRVNISAYTYDLVKDNFECEYRGKIMAKGKGEIDMYFVDGVINNSM